MKETSKNNFLNVAPLCRRTVSRILQKNLHKVRLLEFNSSHYAVHYRCPCTFQLKHFLKLQEDRMTICAISFQSKKRSRKKNFLLDMYILKPYKKKTIERQARHANPQTLCNQDPIHIANFNL